MVLVSVLTFINFLQVRYTRFPTTTARFDDNGGMRYTPRKRRTMSPGHVCIFFSFFISFSISITDLFLGCMHSFSATVTHFEDDGHKHDDRRRWESKEYAYERLYDVSWACGYLFSFFNILLIIFYWYNSPVFRQLPPV